MLYLADDWDTFDTWCLQRGIDAETLTSRRLTNLVITHLSEGADRESKDKFLAELERIGRNIIDPKAEVPLIPDAKPPPGWKSEADNWAGIQAALGGMGMIKGGIHRG